MIKLIKELQNASKPKNKLEQAFEQAIKEFGLKETKDFVDFKPTDLTDEQIEELSDYMNYMIINASDDDTELSPEEAAGLALEDVAGFETADSKTLQNAIDLLVDKYNTTFRK